MYEFWFSNTLSKLTYRMESLFPPRFRANVCVAWDRQVFQHPGDMKIYLHSLVLCLLFTYSAEEYHGYAPKGDATCYLPPCIVAV